MKIIRKHLRRIIREEVTKLATEGSAGVPVEHMTPGERFVHDNGLPTNRGLAELIDSLNLTQDELEDLPRDLSTLEELLADDEG